MHIADGVLSVPVLAMGAAGTVAGVALGLRRLREEDVPKAALLAAAFFVSSLIHLRFGVTSVHLVLNGLLGILLGWAAFPAILLGLVMQLVFFGHGGLTTLGVNTVTMALPAVLLGGAFRCVRAAYPGRLSWLAGVCGGVAVGCSGLLLAVALWTSNRSFWVAAELVLWYHLPIMVAEGLVTGFAVRFLEQVQPGWRGDALPELAGR